MAEEIGKKKKKRKKNCKGDARGEEEQFQSGTNPHLGKGRHLGRGRGVALRPAPAPDARAGLPSPGVEAAARNGFPAKAAVFKPLGS